MNNNYKNSDLQLVPEVILKRKHDMDEMQAHRAAQQILNGPRGNNKVFRKRKAIKVYKPETILAQARSQRNHMIRYKRVLKKGMMKRASDKVVMKEKVVLPDDDVVGNDDVDDNDNVIVQDGAEGEEEIKVQANSVGTNLVFVVRIRDPNGMPNTVKRVLNSFRLKSMNEGVFLRYDATTSKKLHLVENWVTYGIPSKAMISDLIHRRGHGKVDGKRIPLSDNVVIEKQLSDKTQGEVICVQDVVEELYNVNAGPTFKIVNQFLWPFQLSAVRSKFQKQKLNFKDGGDYGDRGGEMDDFIRQVL